MTSLTRALVVSCSIGISAATVTTGPVLAQPLVLEVQYRASPYYAPRHPQHWGYAPPPWGGGQHYAPPVVRKHPRYSCRDYGRRSYYGPRDRHQFRGKSHYGYDYGYRGRR